VNDSLGHDKFHLLVNEAREELVKERENWRLRAIQAAAAQEIALDATATAGATSKASGVPPCPKSGRNRSRHPSSPKRCRPPSPERAPKARRTKSPALPPLQSSGSGGGKRDDVKSSKTLSSILRHRATREGIHIRPDGFCKLQDVLEVTGIAAADIVRIVRDNNKGRFQTKNIASIAHIRACEGHSMDAVKDDALLRQMHLSDRNIPSVCVHGTSRASLPFIQMEGLKPGGGQDTRLHIHFSPHGPRDPKSVVFKKGAEMGIWIDLRKALSEGIPFYMSDNGVILTRGIKGRLSPRLFTKIKDLEKNKVVWRRH
jgi:2'-phosphotransferase